MDDLLTRIHRMKWRSASSARQFRLVDQTVTLDQVAEFCRTRRVKEGIGSLASISAAFGPAGSIHLGNPGQYQRAAMARRAYEIGQSGVARCPDPATLPPTE